MTDNFSQNDGSPSSGDATSGKQLIVASSSLAMLVTAEELLVNSGYSPVSRSAVKVEMHDGMRMFEDQFGVVLIAAFDSVDGLVDLWENSQSVLVSALASNIFPGSAKGWEGYLVLITPASPLDSDLPAIMNIRYDTTRTRKLVITGISNLRRGLAPVLPIPILSQSLNADDPIEFASSWLIERGISTSVTSALLEAYRSQRSMFEAIEGAVLSEKSQGEELQQ